jgi:hypothetical protein
MTYERQRLRKTPAWPHSWREVSAALQGSFSLLLFLFFSFSFRLFSLPSFFIPYEIRVAVLSWVSAKLSRHLPKANPTIRASAARTESTWQPGSHFVGARPARLQLAVLAFKDVPVRPAVAYCANPLDEGRFRLEQVERVMAVARDRHDKGVVGSWVVSSAGSCIAWTVQMQHNLPDCAWGLVVLVAECSSQEGGGVNARRLGV